MKASLVAVTYDLQVAPVIVVRREEFASVLLPTKGGQGGAWAFLCVFMKKVPA